MKIVFIGDIVGRSGREAVLKKLPNLKKKFNPDIIIANAENAASGYGLTEKIANVLFNQGIAVLTLGNFFKTAILPERPIISPIKRIFI